MGLFIIPGTTQKTVATPVMKTTGSFIIPKTIARAVTPTSPAPLAKILTSPAASGARTILSSPTVSTPFVGRPAVTPAARQAMTQQANTIYVAPPPVSRKVGNFVMPTVQKPVVSTPFVGRPLVTPVEQARLKAAAPLTFQGRPSVTPVEQARMMVISNPTKYATIKGTYPEDSAGVAVYNQRVREAAALTELNNKQNPQRKWYQIPTEAQSAQERARLIQQREAWLPVGKDVATIYRAARDNFSTATDALTGFKSDMPKAVGWARWAPAGTNQDTENDKNLHFFFNIGAIIGTVESVIQAIKTAAYMVETVKTGHKIAGPMQKEVSTGEFMKSTQPNVTGTSTEAANAQSAMVGMPGLEPTAAEQAAVANGTPMPAYSPSSTYGIDTAVSAATHPGEIQNTWIANFVARGLGSEAEAKDVLTGVRAWVNSGNYAWRALTYPEQAVISAMPQGEDAVLGIIAHQQVNAIAMGVVTQEQATTISRILQNAENVYQRVGMAAFDPSTFTMAIHTAVPGIAQLGAVVQQGITATQQNLAVPVGQPVTTRQTVAPAPVRTAIPAQATAPVSRILPYATEAPAVSSPVANISTRQLPIATPTAPATQPAAAATKQPYSVDLPDGSRLTITPPAAQVAPAVKEPWQMTRDEFTRNQNEPKLDAIYKALDSGKVLTFGSSVKAWKLTSSVTIKMGDTGELKVATGGHWNTLTDQQVNDLAKEAGFAVPPISEQVSHYGEVKKALEEGKPVPANILTSYPDLETSPSAAISNQETGATTPVEVTAPAIAQDTKPTAEPTAASIGVLYHGSPRKGLTQLHPSQAEGFGYGIYFATSRDYAAGDYVGDNGGEVYSATLAPDAKIADMTHGFPEEEIATTKAYAKYRGTWGDNVHDALQEEKGLPAEAMKELGYDAVIIPDPSGNQTEVVVLNPAVIQGLQPSSVTPVVAPAAQAAVSPVDRYVYNLHSGTVIPVDTHGNQVGKAVKGTVQDVHDMNTQLDKQLGRNTLADQIANQESLIADIKAKDMKRLGHLSPAAQENLAAAEKTLADLKATAPAAVTPVVATDPLTGLGTPEAWQTADKTDKIVATIDMNALLTNSKQYGPDFANTLRVIVAGAMQQEGVQGYGLNKIEVAALFPSQEEADAKMAAVQAVIEETAVNATVDGKTTTLTGWRLDYGTGDDKESADAALAASRTDNARPRWNVQPVRSPAGAATQRKGDTYAANLAVGIRPEASSQQQIAKNNATPWVALGVQPTPRKLLNGIIALGYTLSESSRQMFDTKELNRLPMLQKLFRKSGTKVIGLDELASVLFSEDGINRPQGDMQDDDWLAQQLVAGASKGAGNATKDLFGGEIRTRAVAPKEAQDTELFGKGQKAAFNTQQINAAERGRHLQGQNQRTEQVRQAPADEGILAGEVADLGFNVSNGNLGTNANVTGTQANQPTTAGYEMNVTPSTGTTARTIAAENLQKVVLAVKDYVTTLASHPKMKESDYHAQLQDRLKQLGVPAGLFTPTQILSMYQASKGPSQLWNLTNRVLMKLNAYNTAQTLLAEALNDVPSSVVNSKLAGSLQDATLDSSDLMRSLDVIDRELTKAQVAVDLRAKFDTMLAAVKEKDAARLARALQRAANQLEAQKWLAADKTAKAKDKAEAAAIINYLQNLDLRNFDRPAAMSIQEEVAKAGITVKKPFVTEDYSPFVKALSNMGVHVADPGTAIADQKTLDLPELRALKAKVKALTDLSRLEKAAIATDVRETIEKKKEADIIQLNKGIKASDIENLRKGPYQAPKQGTMDNLLSAIKDVPRWLDVWLDRQQWLLRVLDGYQKGPLWSSLYDDAYRADHNSVGNIQRETGLAHQVLAANGITQTTIAQQRTLPNEMVVTQGDVLLMAAYAGNGHSLQSLVDQNGWSLETIQQAIESMSKGEVAWTNYMLDFMRNTYPLVSDAFSRVNNGASLPDIANFFPMVKQFDPLKGMGQEEAQRQVEDFQELTLNTLSSYGWVNDGTDGKPSFVKHRIQHGEILLQTDVTKTFFDYVQGALDFVERAPVVHSMETIIADKTFKDSFIRKAGLVRWNALGRYVAAVKSPRKALAARNGLEKAARTARFNASAATLGGRVSKAITSAMSYTFGLVRYGPTAMIYGTNELASDFYGSMATIKELAPILYERLVDPIKWEGVVDEMAQSWGGVKKFDIKKLWDLGFTVGDTLDVASSFLGQSWALAKQHPTWDAKKCAYETEQDILQYHTSIKVEDRPEAWRSGEFANNVVAFMGEATAQSMGMFFEAKSAWHGKTPKAKFLTMWIVFTMLMGLMQMAADAISNGRKKKDNSFWNTYPGYVVMANIELVLPFFGRWITGALQGYPASNNVIALKTFDEAKGVLTDLMNGKFGTAALDTLRTIGFAAGIPVLGVDELGRWFAPGNTTPVPASVPKQTKPTKPAPAVQKPHK